MVFELPGLRRSGVLVRQVLIWGAVTDGLTPQEGPRGVLNVRLFNRDTNEDIPLTRKIQPDATYAFYGIPSNAFPPRAARTFHLRVEASAPSYLPAGFNIDLILDADQPAQTTRSYAELDVPDMHVILYTSGLPLEVNLTLNRTAVRLRGRVVRAANPTEGLEGAEVAGGGQTATTNADGFFEFANPLPVVLSLSITITKAGFEDRTETFEPDYTRPINELVVALAT